MQLDCPATVVTDPATGALLCQDGTGAAVAWVVTPSFDPTQIDPATASAAFAGGFVLVGTAWAIGWAVRAVLSPLK